MRASNDYTKHETQKHEEQKIDEENESKNQTNCEEQKRRKRSNQKKTLEIIPILYEANRQKYNDPKLSNERTFASRQRKLTNIRIVAWLHNATMFENCLTIRNTSEQNERRNEKKKQPKQNKTNRIRWDLVGKSIQRYPRKMSNSGGE